MKQINVTFILRGHLMWYPEEKKKIYNLTIDKNLKIIDAIYELRVPVEQISVVLKNGQRSSVNTILHEGDTIEVIPIVAGG